MSRKLFFPILTLILAILACNLPSYTPTPVLVTEASVTPTLVPPVLTDTPVITETPAKPTAVSSDLTLDMLLNGTYQTPFYNRTITLADGNYLEGSDSNTFSVQMLNVYAFGDLNGDGKDDAAIILAENGGGSGTFESVIAVINQGGTPHQESQAQLGDRVLINSIDISSGVIHLNTVVHAPNDPMCCPTLPQKQNYWLVGNKLWLMRLTSTIGGTDHLVNVDSPAIWATVTNPFTVSGSVTVLPFENTLAYHIYIVDGTKVTDSSLTVNPTSGIAGTFSQTLNLSSAGITDWIIIQFVDVSAADGSTIALGSVILKAH
jgi:hypothetical protein